MLASATFHKFASTALAPLHCASKVRRGRSIFLLSCSSNLFCQIFSIRVSTSEGLILGISSSASAIPITPLFYEARSVTAFYHIWHRVTTFILFTLALKFTHFSRSLNFIRTLNFNGKVLYAPSDFKDEQHFIDTECFSNS